MVTTLNKVLYTAQATTTGGRDGHATSSDGVLDVDVRVPEEMGGQGGGTNPEQLFAAGYAACFQSARSALWPGGGRSMLPRRRLRPGSPSGPSTEGPSA